jgi:imidazole glycerol-phosphate synthase subunit HisF
MRRVRIIPVLLLKNGGLVKSVRFRDHKYVGDPINAVRIFNEKEVDEIVLLDISATADKKTPDLPIIKNIVSEAFMPMAYGGGISTLAEIDSLVSSGIEKVVLNNTAFRDRKFISQAAKQVGSQSVVVSIDVKKNWLGKYKVYVMNGSENTSMDPVAFSKQVANEGAGEIFLQSIDQDGGFGGYDLALIKAVSEAVDIPVVALGGAGSVDDFTSAIRHGASATAAGSMFVFQRPHRAVLISYPTQQELKEKVFSQIK